MNKKALLFISILLSLFVSVASCSSDDDKDSDPSMTISTESGEDIITYPGGEIVFMVMYTDNQYVDMDKYSFYIGESQIPNANIIRYSIYVNNMQGSEITATIPDDWKSVSGNLSIRNSEGKTVATGPKVRMTGVYRLFEYAGYAGFPNAKVNALAGTNKVVTMVEREPGARKKMTMEFKGYNEDKTANIERGWQDLPFPVLDGVSATTSLPDGLGRTQGFSTRDGITYIAQYYSNRNTSTYFFGAIQEFRGIIQLCGEHTYGNPFIASSILDIEQNKDNKLFYRVYNNPNAIYKMSEIEAPVLWAGSATESGKTDGSLLNARFENVVGMDRDSKDNLYIAQKDVIRMVTPQGVVSTLSKFKFADIQAFTVAPDDRIYVLDRTNKSMINIIDTQQETLSAYNIIRGFTSESVSIDNTNNIGVSADGVVYFVSYTGSYFHVYHALVPADWKAAAE